MVSWAKAEGIEVEGLDQYLGAGIKRLRQRRDSPKDPCLSTLASLEAVIH